jgi:hypothetical protein
VDIPGVVGRFGGTIEEGVLGVERGVVACDLHLAVEFVGTGLGEDLDAAIAEAVVLRGEGILIDADFADGGFGRELAAGESIDVNLAAIGTCGGAGERGELVLQFVGIVGERVEIFAFDNDGAGIGVGSSADGSVLGLDLDLLLLHLNLKGGVEIFHLAGGDDDAGHAIRGKSRSSNPHAVGTGSEAVDRVGSPCIRGGLGGDFAFAAEDDDAGTGNDGARGIGDLTANAAGGLAGRGGWCLCGGRCSGRSCGRS